MKKKVSKANARKKHIPISKPARKPEKTTVRETAESSYFKLGARLKKRNTISRFSTKSFFGRDQVFREIRKKQYSAKKQTLHQIVKANKRFTVGETVFARVAYQTKENEIKWASTPRQFIEDEDALEGVISLLMHYADEYSGKKDSIEGFDIEKTLTEFGLKAEELIEAVIEEMQYLWRALLRNDKKLQQSQTKQRTGKKKVKKIRGSRSRNK